jgi:uncharacterized membrane protein YfcA
MHGETGQLTHTELQFKALAALWSLGTPSYPSDIKRYHQAKGFNRPYESWRTVLDRLNDKSILTRERVGNRWLYTPTLSKQGAFGAALLLGAGIGFYDGFFGPGTGAFLIFVFVRAFGFDFLHASAHAKLVNATTNIGALLYFIPSGEILWLLAVVMAVSNVVGATLGTMLAIRRGSDFVRQFFLFLLAVLILRMAWTTWEMFL